MTPSPDHGETIALSNSPPLPRAQTRAVQPLFRTRRRFLREAGLGLGLVSVAPHLMISAEQPASLTLAGIGVGGVGFGQLQECEQAGFQIVALCDVDQVYAQKAFDRWPKARRYRDYRELLAKERDVEAVYVGTPDHTHAVICMEALRQKKHLCCVKPLTRTLHECQTIIQAAKQAGVATQVTAAPHTTEPGCRTEELIRSGALGAIHEVHVWSNRPVWPQGMLRPPGEDPIPSGLDWNEWIGPAPMRPFKGNWPEEHYARKLMKSRASWVAGYSGVYHPFNFRGWWDFGTGALGDMGCHHFNAMAHALQLSHPTRITATATRVMEETAPLASMVTYDFPARGSQPPVRVVWYDGGLQPPPPAEFPDQTLPEEGTLYLGETAKLLVSWDGLRILPDSKARLLDSVPRELPRRGGTWLEWLTACQGGEKAGCDFEWAGVLTDMVLLGNIAIRAEKSIEWDPASRRIINVPDANRWVQEPYRQGWTL